jgi:hypothetical protein
VKSRKDKLLPCEVVVKKARELDAEIINYDEKQVISTTLEICNGGPDICIDATSFRYAKEIVHKVERLLRLEVMVLQIIFPLVHYLTKVLHFVTVLFVYRNIGNYS